MSNTESYTPYGRSNPVSTMFAMQRQSIKQGQQFLQQGMSMQKQLPRAWQDAVESQRSVQKTGLDASRTMAKGMLQMMEATVPSEQQLIRQGEHDAADVSEQQHEAFENLHQAVEDQFDAVEEINDQTWESVEQQLEDNSDTFAEFVEQSTSFTEESMNAFVDSLEDVQSDMESQIESGVEAASDVQPGSQPPGTDRMDTDDDYEE